MAPAGRINEDRVAWAPRWRRLCAVMLALIVAVTLANGQVARPLRIYLAAGASSFNLVDWEVRSVLPRLDRVLGGFTHAPRSDSDDAELGRSYLLAPMPGRAPLRDGAEAAMERQLASVLLSEGIGGSLSPAGVFPPVSFRFVAPLSLLVVAPRDRLVVDQSIFLAPALDTAEIGNIERRVESLGMSALVTPIGGLGTYPAMVVESRRPGDVLTAIAHEWTHAYLAFYPLGRAYWSSQQARAINETVADLTGRELGAAMAERLGVAAPAEPGRSAPDLRFRGEMRETRQEVEHLLSEGFVDQAEAYMEQRRQYMSALGYQIRRLNQAYFAFHGSYAESAAGDNRLGRLVRQVRTESESLASFLAAVRGVQSLDQLEALTLSMDPYTARPEGDPDAHS